MRLSALQKYILKQCFLGNNSKISKKVIENFYSLKTVKAKNIINDITKSVDRMIIKELITGYGTKTAKKWYIKEVGLSPKGKRLVRAIFVQQKLPFKKT